MKVIIYDAANIISRVYEVEDPQADYKNGEIWHERGVIKLMPRDRFVIVSDHIDYKPGEIFEEYIEGHDIS